MELQCPAPAYFMLRVTRLGPLVPAKLWWSDAEPGDPDNKLDRGRLSPYPRAEIAGEAVPPERLLDRLGVWRRRGDYPLLPHEALAMIAGGEATPRPVGHWAYAEPIDGSRYAYEIDRLRWAERHRPTDPALNPRRAIDPRQMPLPSFERENAT